MYIYLMAIHRVNIYIYMYPYIYRRKQTLMDYIVFFLLHFELEYADLQ